MVDILRSNKRNYAVVSDDALDQVFSDRPAKPTKKEIAKKWLKRLAAFVALVVAILQGLGAGANNAAAVLRTLPSLGAISLGLSQALVLGLGVLGAFMNFYVMYKLLPNTFKSIYYFFKDFKTNWRKSRGKCIAIFVAMFGSVCAGVAVAAFTFSSTPITIMGVMALFGATAASFSPPVLALLTGIAAVLAIIQAVAIFALLFNSAQRGILSFSKQKARNFFNATWWPRKATLTHSQACIDEQEALLAIDGPCTHKGCNCLLKQRISMGLRVAFTLIGGLVVAAAAVFMTVVEGADFYSVLKGLITDIPESVAQTLTVGMIYIASGILNIILNLDIAHSIYGPFGAKLGRGLAKMGYAFKHPVETFNSIDWYQTAKTIVFGIIPAIWFTIRFFIPFVGNTAGNAAAGGLGVPGDNPHNASAQHIKDLLSPKDPQPAALRDYVTTPQQTVSMSTEQIVACATAGGVSASTILHIEGTCGKGSKDKAKLFSRVPTRTDSASSFAAMVGDAQPATFASARAARRQRHASIEAARGVHTSRAHDYVRV